MKRMILLLLLGLIFVVQPVQARLGETLAQCIERYGPVQEEVAASVTESDAKACIFSKKGVTTLVEFKNGTAWRIVFRLKDMTPGEAESLLKANLPEGGWGAALKFDGQEYRLSANRRRVAVYAPTKASTEISTLTIASRDYADASYAACSARIAEALKNVKEHIAGKDLKDF
ncbi:MAG: hypothetical protein K1X78_25220 [Verrucomicrobiaceae bacterium]|nr:hypothetical protein [Verrucomicrobiaceae bacterium]